MGQVNIRIADEKVEATRARLKEAAGKLGISQGDVLERGLDLVEGGKGLVVSEDVGVAQKTYERAGRIENIVEEVLELVQSSSAAAPVVQGSVESAVPAGDAPFHPTCKHCGVSFGAWNRFASICPGCKALGHVGDSRECSVCFENRGGL